MPAASVNCVWKGFYDAHTPHAPLPEISAARLAAATDPLPYAVRLVGATADRSQGWEHLYRIRQSTYRDVYFPLRPPSAAPVAPAALIELDQTSPAYETALWNMVDPPGAREGLAERLDDWTANELRRAGVVLAPNVVLLKRQQLHGLDPRPDLMDDGVLAVLPGVLLAFALLFWFAVARAARRRVGEPAVPAARPAPARSDVRKRRGGRDGLRRPPASGQ